MSTKLEKPLHDALSRLRLTLETNARTTTQRDQEQLEFEQRAERARKAGGAKRGKWADPEQDWARTYYD